MLDARSHERFPGEVVQIDKPPGHIPGRAQRPVVGGARLRHHAPSRPTSCATTTANLGVDGDHDVVAYCGSGVSACMNMLAMEHAGLGTPRLYVASWSGWSADPNREAATGE